VAKGEEADDRVHVFTVASGHMYERLQKIMVLSVLRNTKCAALSLTHPMQQAQWLCTPSSNVSIDLELVFTAQNSPSSQQQACN
jgi:hypothetical protein